MARGRVGDETGRKTLIAFKNVIKNDRETEKWENETRTRKSKINKNTENGKKNLLKLDTETIGEGKHSKTKHRKREKKEENRLKKMKA